MHLTKEERKKDEGEMQGWRGNWKEREGDSGRTLTRSGLLGNIRLVPNVLEGEDIYRIL